MRLSEEKLPASRGLHDYIYWYQLANKTPVGLYLEVAARTNQCLFYSLILQSVAGNVCFTVDCASQHSTINPGWANESFQPQFSSDLGLGLTGPAARWAFWGCEERAHEDAEGALDCPGHGWELIMIASCILGGKSWCWWFTVVSDGEQRLVVVDNSEWCWIVVKTGCQGSLTFSKS